MHIYVTGFDFFSVSLVKETGGHGENHQVSDKLYHIMLYTLSWSRFEHTTSVVIGTDCIGSCKSNYHGHDPPPFFVQYKWNDVYTDNTPFG
jgi:hypothetical protein